MIFVKVELFLGWTGSTAVASQPDSGGFWKRQDNQEWQLVSIRKKYVLKNENFEVHFSVFNLVNNNWSCSLLTNDE